MTVADVNGDGKLDLLVANQSSTVSVLLNTTAPGATTPESVAFRGSLNELRILFGINWLQGELYTDFWLAISVLHVAFHDILLILFALILG